MEIYYEQNVVNNDIDNKIKKTRTLTIAKTVCITIALGALLTIILFAYDQNLPFWVMIFVLIATPFIIAAIIIGRINKRNNTEYDYVIDGDSIKITEVYFRESRKLKHDISLRTIESVGVFESDGYKKAQALAQKKILALVNYDDEKSIMYVLFNTNKGRTIIFMEPDRGFIVALKRSVSAITIFDKSMSELEQKLTEEELG